MSITTRACNRPVVNPPCATSRRSNRSLLRPVGKFGLIADTLEIGGPFLEESARVGDRLIVDSRSQLLEKVVEQQIGLEVTDVLFELLVNVSLQRGDGLFPRLI